MSGKACRKGGKQLGDRPIRSELNAAITDVEELGRDIAFPETLKTQSDIGTVGPNSPMLTVNPSSRTMARMVLTVPL